jgi:hypothetical protein
VAGNMGRSSLYRISEVGETKLIGMYGSSSNLVSGVGGSMHSTGPITGAGVGINQPGGGLFPWSPEQDPLGLNGNTGGGVDANGMMQDSAPKLFLNQQQLARSWDVSQRSTPNDWHEWLSRFNLDLLRESPIPTMRACAPLAQSHIAMVSLCGFVIAGSYSYLFRAPVCYTLFCL